MIKYGNANVEKKVKGKIQVFKNKEEASIKKANEKKPTLVFSEKERL